MRRQIVVLCGFLLAFGLIISRLFYWQIIKGEILAQAASDQYYFKLTIPAGRGEIKASDGNPLVTNTTGYLVYAQPKEITNKLEFSKKLSDLLEVDKDIIETRIAPENIVWAPLAHKIDGALYQKLKAANLTGLGFEKEGKRFYPEASMAAQLLGFVGSDSNGDDTGYFGLEGFYDRALKGQAGSLIQEKDARGLPILLGSGKRIPAEDGQSLELYLDRTVQLIAQQKLAEGITKYGAKSGLVAIIEPKTGGILASAAFPAFDPREFTKYDKDAFANPLIATTYEPGSTFKTLVMAAGLNEKVVEPNTTYNEEKPVQIGEYAIQTWNNQYHGLLTMTQVLEKSSNPGMVFVGRSLGLDRLYGYIQRFGFGEKTGVDLEGEEAANLRPQKDWHEIDLATASFGQGIAVTPLQMLRAVAALANAGQLMEPHLVKKIIDPQGKTIETQPKKIGQVVSPATAKVVTEMMINAVDQGEAKWAKPPGYRIAGKTGTAQIPVAGHYDTTKTIASFIGFAPADNPKFVMLTILREPSSSQWGSETAAPLFFSIAKELFSYYGISPKD